MGWIVSNKYKFIFIHIPKTGGTSIAEPAYGESGEGALIPYLGDSDIVNFGHIRAAGLKERMGAQWDQYFKFCFVRNPWDRLISLYHYFIQDREKTDSALGKRIKAAGNFRKFCMNMDNMELDAHFDNQTSYIADFDGQSIVDFIAKYETMEEDFRSICDRLGLPAIKLPHYRKSSHRDYRSYYSDEMMLAVESRYKNDIRVLDYKF